MDIRIFELVPHFSPAEHSLQGESSSGSDSQGFPLPVHLASVENLISAHGESPIIVYTNTDDLQQKNTLEGENNPLSPLDQKVSIL